jgi:hypothetical protein
MKRTTTLLTAGGIAIGLAGTGLAAVNAVTSTPTYHGCVVGTNRVLQNVHTKTVTCPTGDLSVTWNQTGPQGVQGPSGTGTAGPGGLDVRIIGGQISGPSLLITCPASHPYALGTGYTSDPPGISQNPPVAAIDPQLFDNPDGSTYAHGYEFTNSSGDQRPEDVFVTCAK